MKVYFYINTLGGGGAERVVANLASNFAKTGQQVALITSFATKDEYNILQAVRRYVLEEINGTNDDAFTKNIRRVVRLRKIVKRDKPDILISFMAEPNFRALTACIGLRAKNLISVRNDPDREYPNAIYRILAKTLYRLADGVVFQTKDAQKWFPPIIQARSCIILNPVEQEFFDASFDGIRRDVISVGRLVPQKNYAMLIRAFASIANQIEDDLYIYGEGELREELEALVREMHMDSRIFLLGAARDVAETIKGAKLFVLSSDYEGLPNALMEAMALGLPCIATDCPCGGPRELLGEGEYGVLTPVGDVNALADTMANLLGHPQKLKQLGARALLRSNAFESDSVYACWYAYMKDLTD